MKMPKVRCFERHLVWCLGTGILPTESEMTLAKEDCGDAWSGGLGVEFVRACQDETLRGQVSSV